MYDESKMVQLRISLMNELKKNDRKMNDHYELL